MLNSISFQRYHQLNTQQSFTITIQTKSKVSELWSGEMRAHYTRLCKLWWWVTCVYSNFITKISQIVLNIRPDWMTELLRVWDWECELKWFHLFVFVVVFSALLGSLVHLVRCLKRWLQTNKQQRPTTYPFSGPQAVQNVSFSANLCSDTQTELFMTYNIQNK